MKKSLSAVKIITSACAVFLFAAACNNGNDPEEDPQRPLTLLTPKGGSGVQFSVGDTVLITWRINNTIPDSERVASVGIRYSMDGGATFPSNQFIYWGGSIPVDTTWYSWIIDSAHISGQFVIKIYEYLNTTPCDQSAPFVIVP